MKGFFVGKGAKIEWEEGGVGRWVVGRCLIIEF